MVHIFVIHSNTVLLTALGVIEKEKIEYGDILFMYGRNFRSSIVPEAIKCVDISDLYSCKEEYGILGRRFRLRKYAKKFDAFLSEYVNKPYQAYVPHTGSRIFQALCSNKLCIATNWLQEGAYSFFTKPLTDPRRIRRYNLFFSSKRFWYQTNWSITEAVARKIHAHKAYALRDSFFSPLQERGVDLVQIKWPQTSNREKSIPDGSNVFIFESAVELGQIEKDVYMAGCRKLIVASGVKECYLKFHPNQKKENVTNIVSMFKGRSIKYCPEDYPFELIMSSAQGLHLFGFTTSLLKFGEDLGHKVTRGTDYLRKSSKLFDSYCSSMGQS